MRRFSTASVLRWSVVGLLLGAAGCVESYMPDVADVPTNYLVVDGFIKGNGVTRIKLTRSVGLSGSAVPVEKGAKIAIVDNTGVRYNLTEKAAGSYQSDSLQLDSSRQYQLRFTTSAGVAYASELVPLKVTPPIDKLDWRRDSDHIQVLLDTHDATGQARYYRWRFTETWEFNSAYESNLEYDPVKQIVDIRRTPVFTCWRTEQKLSLRQGSSANLSQDALKSYQVLAQPGTDERFVIRYSVLVDQYAETAEEFAYYELLRKNTEAVGGVNDPLPVPLTGNVHRLDNAAEPVLGHVGAHTVQQNRLFISRQALNLPAGWVFTTPYDACKLGFEDLDGEGIHPPQTKVYNNPNSVPIKLDVNPYTSHLGYYGSTLACVDCRVRGSNVKPSYW